MPKPLRFEAVDSPRVRVGKLRDEGRIVGDPRLKFLTDKAGEEGKLHESSKSLLHQRESAWRQSL